MSPKSQPNAAGTDSLRDRLRRWLAPNTSNQAHRGRLLLETLEKRQLLAGDVDLFATDGDSGVADSFVPSEELIVTGQAQGEPAPNLQQFAIDLADAGVRFFGADWCAACTQQKELFQDGKDNLPFIEVTGPDRTTNATGIAEGITVFPTWEFPDGSRAEGVQTLTELSTRSGVAIPQTDEPTFEPVGNQTVEIGAPLHIPIDAYDPDGGPQTVTVTVDNPDLIEAVVLSGNRSIRIDLETYGDMVFELFEQRAPRATGRVIELAEDNFYDGIIFHRVIDNFVLQAGDPTSTGAGGSQLGDFDDDFHPDLQHNQNGTLSYAKAGDDTNDSQFFITEGTTRHLDFNHSVFGLLVEGEDVREAISEHAVDGNDRPTIDVTIETIDVFNDTENSVVMLRALGDTPGATNATITVTDEDGNRHSETIQITVVPDAVNANPFLDDIIIPSAIPPSSPTQLQLTAIDLENDPVFFSATSGNPAADGTVSVDSSTGLLTVTPAANFTGTFVATVNVQAASGGALDTQRIAFNVEAGAVAVPTGLTLLAGTDSGSSNVDGVTNSGTLTFSVSGTTPGASVEIINVDTGLNIGVATAPASSEATTTTVISTNNLATLGDGTYSLVARQTLNGTTSDISPSIVVQFDGTAPAPVSSSATTTANVGVPYTTDLISSEEGSGLIYALTSGPDGATIDSVTGVISWTPSSNQVGANAFGVSLTDLAGNQSNDSFTVQVSGEPSVEFKIELVDTDGNAVTSVEVGDRFTLRVLAADARELVGGLFTAHTDVFFDNTIIRPVSGASIVHGNDFSIQPNGNITNGLLDEVGGRSPQTGFTNIAESLLFSLEMEAIATGTTTIRTEPTDVVVDPVTLFGINDLIPTADIGFGSATLNVGQSFTVSDDSFTVEEDSGATAVNVLANDQFGAGNTLTVVSITQPATGGTASLVNGEVSFTPDANFSGTTEFTYRVSDTNGIQESATVTMTVSGLNDVPTGVDDSFNVDQNSSSNTLDVLANDNDVDPGTVLSVVDTTPSSNDATIEIAADGQSIVYTPQTNFSGVDTFSYTLSDGIETTNVSVSVTVTPSDAPPTATNDAFTVTEDAAEAEFDVTANDTTDDTNQSFLLDSAGTPSRGGTARISSDGTQFFYQPAADFFGSETVTYTIRDTGGGLAVGTVTFTVDGVNDPPPVISTSVNLNRGDGETSVLTISDLPTNVDGVSETLTFDSVGAPSAGGTATVGSNGDILYTPPAADFVGTDTFTYVVSDGNGLTNNGTVTIQINDFRTRDIVVAGSIDDRYFASLGGIHLTGRDVLGATVDAQLETVDGTPLFNDVLPGEYQVQIPAVSFLQNGAQPQSIPVTSLASDGDATVEVNLGRIRPEFISIRDWLGSTPRESVLVAVAPGETSVLAAPTGSTATITSPSASLNADATSVTLTGTDSSGASVEAVLNANDNAAVDFRGQEGDLMLFKINVEADTTSFTAQPAASSVSSTAQGEQIQPASLNPPAASGVEAVGSSKIESSTEPATQSITTEIPSADPSDFIDQTLSLSGTPQGEQIAAAASSRADVFVPTNSDFLGSSDVAVLQTNDAEVFDVSVQHDDQLASLHSNQAASFVSPRSRLLASSEASLAEARSGSESDNQLDEAAIDEVLLGEI